MPQKSSFFDSTAEDQRLYAARDWANYFSKFISNGIFNGGTNLQVTASGNDANVRLAIGSAWINGYMYEVYDAPMVLPIQPAGSQDRIDRIILRLDTSLPVRSIRAMVLQGMTSANAQPPALVRSGDIYDLSLAQIRVVANSSIITPANITDERLNNAVCGLVNSLIRVDTQQFQQQWDAFIASVQNQGFATPSLVTERINSALASLTWQKHALTQSNGRVVNLPSNTNLNDVLTPGQYDGAGLLNAPSADWHYIEVIAHSSGLTHVMQRASKLDTVVPSFFLRFKRGDVWGEWSPDLFQSGVNAKAGAVASLNAMGVAANTGEDWDVINAKIRQIYTGIKSASGIAYTPSTGSGDQFINVTGLSFLPTVIVVESTSTAYLHRKVYMAAATDSLLNTYGYNKSSVYRATLNSGSWTVSSTGFSTPVTGFGVGYRWYAFEI